MTIYVVMLIIGLILLIKFSDIFVDAASSLAIRFKVPKMMIALSVAAFCTCAPELAISFNSISTGNAQMAIANVVGSSIVNILLIIGIATIVRPIRIEDRTIKRELPLLLLVTSTFFLLINDNLFHKGIENCLTRSDGIILILWFIAFCFYLKTVTKNYKKEKNKQKPKFTKVESIITIIACVIGIIIGSDMVVESAVSLAESFGVSQKIITMTIIVIGTSLPELTLTVISAKKGEFDMAIGNIIGTNIFNICVVLGLPITIFGTVYSSGFNIIDISIVLLSAILLFIFGFSGRRLARREGILMLVIFISYYIYLFLS